MPPSPYREYDDETVVYDFPNSGGPSPWDSYGTQQQYTPYRGEAFDLRTSPQGLPNEPPKVCINYVEQLNYMHSTCTTWRVCVCEIQCIKID